MYRHLLVPLVSGDLAFEVVGRALSLARQLGARVTFLHALQDDGHPSVGPVQLLAPDDPALRDTRRTGRTRELLAKAESGARALGVPGAARWTRGQAPAAAIVDAAQALGCDVIFLAPEAHGGVGSGTLAVLATAGVPVLVAPIAAPEHRAIAVLRDEHRAISAVIHACTSLLAAAREADGIADPQALRAALATLRGGRLADHHAREESHLFTRLRARTPELDGEIEELKRQHVRDVALLEELAQRITALEEAGGVAARKEATRALEQAVDRFAELHWEHMGREEAIMLPAARALLSEQDWAELDALLVHAPGTQPAPELDFRQLLAHIG